MRGGITEVKKIASMAEAYDVALAPHIPLSPIALVSCVQVDAYSPNAFIQEQSLNIHYNEDNDLVDYLDDASVFKFTDGFIDLPDGLGLGINLNEPYIRERAKEDVNWRTTVWRHKDGSIAEW